MKRVLIVAGGTGGHIFPALAVAEQLLSQGCEVSWLGAKYGLEAKLVPDKFPMTLMPMRGMRRSGLLAKLFMPWRMLVSLTRAFKIIRKLKPDVVLAMGGYVAAPAGLAAWLNRVPLVIHEQNAKAGLTNRLLARFAKVRMEAFSGALPGKGSITIGNPVRKGFLQVPSPESRYDIKQEKLKILVVGGSQGARAINRCLIETWQRREPLEDIQVWHQSGALDYEEVKSAYAELPIDAKVEAFIDDMVAAYRWADLVICRAGALTISEIATVGVASILIPYPYAADNHQVFNARYLSDHSAATLIQQADVTPAKMEQMLLEALNDKQSLLKMAQSAKKLAKLEAAEKVADQCMRC